MKTYKVIVKYGNTLVKYPVGAETLRLGLVGASDYFIKTFVPAAQDWEIIEIEEVNEAYEFESTGQ